MLAVAVIVGIVLLAPSGSTRAALERPAYSPGDRWVYVLSGPLGIPGFNDTQNGTFALTLAGRVEVEVAGFEDADVNGTPTRAARVLTRTTGFINGTFDVPGLPTPAAVAGTISSNASELWEDRGYQIIRSAGNSETVLDVTLIVSTRFEVRIRTSANVSVVQADPFPLEVGVNATASLHQDVFLSSTFVALGNVTSFEGRSVIDTDWQRQVLALETVHVDAGDFSAYRLNQSLLGFPGLPFAVPSPGDYEIAHFSNDVGFYVKRVAYTNGTQAAELRLKSYTYAARAPPFPWLPLILVVAAAVAVATALVLWRRSRRRRERRAPPAGGPGPGAGPGGGNAR